MQVKRRRHQRDTVMPSHRRILIVDNNEELLRLVNRTLELEGFDTVIVTDYEVALRILGNLVPDIVILDTSTPQVKILEIIDRVRVRSDVPIIVLVADYEAETLRDILEHGADDVIRKPFGARTLVARIRAKLKRYPSRHPG